MDLIRIVGLELRCIVGLRSYERHRQQPLLIDLALGLDLSSAGRSGKIADSVDYADVADTITALLRFREYRLLEVAAEEAAALLFATYPTVGRVDVRLDKPEALAGRARAAAVEVSRSRGAFGATEEGTDYGGRTEILTTLEGAIERLRVAAGSEVVLEDGRRRLECIASGKGRGRFSTVEAGQRSVYRAGESDLLVCRCMAVEHDLSGEREPK
jgi:dihydroneopterin aldolase